MAKWTQEDVETLWELAKTRTASQVAQVMGMNTSRVWNKAKHTGIKFGGKAKPGGRQKNQLCWNCKWSTGLEKKCPWTFKNPTLPKGCEAKEVYTGDVKTYAITKCPLFAEG